MDISSPYPTFYNDGSSYRTLVNQSVVFLDNQKVILGTGSDASIYYDGTDVVISTADVGSGVLKFGTFSADTDATTHTGYITIKDSSGTSRKLAVVS
tara:strand:- start:3920 stop:4210 length:291 start_codon:yes stop_codon:yes gene_type:complete